MKSLIIVGLLLLYFNQPIVRFFKNSKQFLLNVVKCLLLFFATLFILLTINFILLRFLPGDPVLELVPNRYEQERYEEAYRELGLHLPLIQQYFLYIRRLFTGDWGVQYIMGPGSLVSSEIADRFPRMIELLLFPGIIGLILGFFIGKYSARTRKKWVDRIDQFALSFGVAFPVIWLGLILQYVLAYQMNLLPVRDYKSSGVGYPTYITGFSIIDSLIEGNFDQVLDTLHHFILPGSILALSNTLVIAWVIRLNYKRISREKSLLMHNIKTGIVIGIIITNTLLIETIFTFHAMGEMFISALVNSAYNLLSVTVFLITLIITVTLLISNILFYWWKEREKRGKLLQKVEVIIQKEERKSSEDLKKYILERIKSPISIIGLTIIFFAILLSIFPQIITPYTFLDVNALPGGSWSPPSINHPLGQTQFGRDVLARMIFGIREAIVFGGLSLLVGIIGGLIIVVIINYTVKTSKWANGIIKWLISIIYTVPPLILLMYIIMDTSGSTVEINFYRSILIYGVFLIPIFTHLLREGEKRNIKIMIMNISKKLIIYIPLIYGIIILLHELVGYLGFVDLHMINLGRDIDMSLGHIVLAPWASYWPGFATFMLVLGFFLLYHGMSEKILNAYRKIYL